MLRIDEDAAKRWTFPKNLSVRKYQVNICRTALENNTLVCLPTGLGKTLIAAVLIYNFYQYYPNGKIVFMAPTRPLVFQQIKACKSIMCLPSADIAHLEGSISVDKRQAVWEKCRIFFCTPQILANDLKNSNCGDPKKFVLVVVDEAHRATDNYAYTQVVKYFSSIQHSQYRMLALSATPGSDIRAVQKVIYNLNIAKVEIRSEDDAELAPYVHLKQVEVIKCSGGAMAGKQAYGGGGSGSTQEQSLLKTLNALMFPAVSFLHSHSVLLSEKVDHLTQFLLEDAEEACEQRKADGTVNAQSYFEAIDVLKFLVECKRTFQLRRDASQLRIAMEDKMHRDWSGAGDSTGNMFFVGLFRSGPFKSLMSTLNSIRKIGSQSGPAVKNAGKLAKLREVLQEHFTRHARGGSSTRAIVFAEMRTTVYDIVSQLSDIEGIMAHEFVGQSGSSSSSLSGSQLTSSSSSSSSLSLMNVNRLKVQHGAGSGGGGAGSSVSTSVGGLNQQEQAQVISHFHSGQINVLVATCVAEEGLDIGDVDLIILFDSVGSPTRLVQRMGRTGRKRSGRVIMLTSDDHNGRDDAKIEKCSMASEAIMAALYNPNTKFLMYRHNPRLIPAHVQPEIEYKLFESNSPMKQSRAGAGASTCGGGTAVAQRVSDESDTAVHHDYEMDACDEYDNGFSHSEEPSRMHARDNFDSSAGCDNSCSSRQTGARSRQSPVDYFEFGAPAAVTANGRDGQSSAARNVEPQMSQISQKSSIKSIVDLLDDDDDDGDVVAGNTGAYSAFGRPSGGNNSMDRLAAATHTSAAGASDSVGANLAVYKCVDAPSPPHQKTESDAPAVATDDFYTDDDGDNGGDVWAFSVVDDGTVPGIETAATVEEPQNGSGKAKKVKAPAKKTAKSIPQVASGNASGANNHATSKPAAPKAPKATAGIANYFQGVSPNLSKRSAAASTSENESNGGNYMSTQHSRHSLSSPVSGGSKPVAVVWHICILCGQQYTPAKASLCDDSTCSGGSSSSGARSSSAKDKDEVRTCEECTLVLKMSAQEADPESETGATHSARDETVEVVYGASSHSNDASTPAPAVVADRTVGAATTDDNEIGASPVDFDYESTMQRAVRAGRELFSELMGDDDYERNLICPPSPVPPPKSAPQSSNVNIALPASVNNSAPKQSTDDSAARVTTASAPATSSSGYTAAVAAKIVASPVTQQHVPPPPAAPLASIAVGLRGVAKRAIPAAAAGFMDLSDSDSSSDSDPDSEGEAGTESKSGCSKSSDSTYAPAFGTGTRVPADPGNRQLRGDAPESARAARVEEQCGNSVHTTVKTSPAAQCPLGGDPNLDHQRVENGLLVGIRKNGCLVGVVKAGQNPLLQSPSSCGAESRGSAAPPTAALPPQSILKSTGGRSSSGLMSPILPNEGCYDDNYSGNNGYGDDNHGIFEDHDDDDAPVLPSTVLTSKLLSEHAASDTARKSGDLTKKRAIQWSEEAVYCELDGSYKKEPSKASKYPVLALHKEKSLESLNSSGDSKPESSASVGVMEKPTANIGKASALAPNNFKHKEFCDSLSDDTLTDDGEEEDEDENGSVSSEEKRVDSRSASTNRDISSSSIRSCIDLTQNSAENDSMTNQLGVLNSSGATEQECSNAFSDNVSPSASDEGDSASDEDGDACCVCGDTAFTEQDKIIYCDGECNSCVHVSCYYGERVLQHSSMMRRILKEDFYCGSCAEKKQLKATIKAKGSGKTMSKAAKKQLGEIHCGLCNITDGMMIKHSEEGYYYHPVCVLYTPELSVDADTMQLRDVEALEPDRKHLICTVCRGKGGACIQCAHSDCVVACHPYCGLKAFRQMVVRFDNSKCSSCKSSTQQSGGGKYRRHLSQFDVGESQESPSSGAAAWGGPQVCDDRPLVYEIYCNKHASMINGKASDIIMASCSQFYSAGVSTHVNNGPRTGGVGSIASSSTPTGPSKTQNSQRGRRSSTPQSAGTDMNTTQESVSAIRRRLGQSKHRKTTISDSSSDDSDVFPLRRNRENVPRFTVQKSSDICDGEYVLQNTQVEPAAMSRYGYGSKYENSSDDDDDDDDDDEEDADSATALNTKCNAGGSGGLTGAAVEGGGFSRLRKGIVKRTNFSKYPLSKAATDKDYGVPKLLKKKQREAQTEMRKLAFRRNKAKSAAEALFDTEAMEASSDESSVGSDSSRLEARKQKKKEKSSKSHRICHSDGENDSSEDEDEYEASFINDGEYTQYSNLDGYYSRLQSPHEGSSSIKKKNRRGAGSEDDGEVGDKSKRDRHDKKLRRKYDEEDAERAMYFMINNRLNQTQQEEATDFGLGGDNSGDTPITRILRAQQKQRQQSKSTKQGREQSARPRAAATSSSSSAAAGITFRGSERGLPFIENILKQNHP